MAAAQNSRNKSEARAKGAAANSVGWRDASPAPVVLIAGPEEYLGIRAMDRIRAEVRSATPDVELTKLNAASYEAGSLAMTVAPSLFVGACLGFCFSSLRFHGRCHKVPFSAGR